LDVESRLSNLRIDLRVMNCSVFFTKLDNSLMKNIFTYLLVISVGFNIYFISYLMDFKKSYDENKKLYFWKDISYGKGYEFLDNKMKMDFPEAGFKQKPSLIYFWNTSDYDFKCAGSMRGLDSLASCLGEYSFNYIFANEMDEVELKDFLTIRRAKYKNFKVLGGMDDFISGVYNEKPPKRKLIRLSKQSDSNCSDILKKKIGGYYLLIDSKGEILYSNYKFFTPLKDTTLMRLLKSFPKVKRFKSEN
jgi:hypothetical protein